MTKVVVIGGGITGLVAAYRLSKVDPAIEITVVERDHRLGGKLLTDQHQGFVIDGGADRIPASAAAITSLCAELGLTHALHHRDPRHAKMWVKYGGALYPLTMALSELLPTNLATLAEHPLISSAGRKRLHQEAPSLPSTTATDEPVATFVATLLGREVYDKLLEPLISSIYASDCDQLSAAALFPHRYQLARTTEQAFSRPVVDVPGQPEPSSSTLAGGMATLVHALCQQLPDDALITGERVTYLRRNRTRGGYMIALDSGDVLAADALIVTTPAFMTARLVDSLDAPLAALHATIPYASTAVVTLAYQPKVGSTFLPALEGYGYVLPQLTSSDIRACAYSSNLWLDRAPTGALLLRVMMGRYGQRNVTECSDAELLAMACQEVETTLALPSVPTFSRIYRWPLSLPQYTVGHLDRVAQIEVRLAGQPGLFLAGAAYRGIDISSCIRDGERAAEAAQHYLQDHQRMGV